MSDPIRIGIVGMGRAGWGMHISELSGKTDKFQVVAACDLLPERVQKTIDRCGCKGYDNIDDLIADPDVEIVDIATRSIMHYEHAKKALTAGKSVILEKPVSMNYDQIAELFSMANKPGKPRLFVRQNRRIEEKCRTTKKIIDSGILGDVYEIDIVYRGYQRRDDWQTLREFGGGQVMNWGSHVIDHALVLLDSEVKTQHGDLRQVAAGGDCEDCFWLYLVGENNRKVSLCFNNGSALNAGNRIEVYGNRGAMEFANDHVRMRYIDPEQKLPPVIADPGTPDDTFGSTGTFAMKVEPNWIEEEYDVPETDLRVIWDQVYDSYRNGAEYPIKEEEVLRMMKTITRLYAENELIDFTLKESAE